ncbi:hypothetical protein DYB35_013618, partial [Aphanomyces astaci]
MPRSKTRKPQLAVTKDIGDLFDYPDLPVKLRQDLYVLTRHQRVVINKLRAQIPEAKNSDARNAIQEITDLLIHRNDQTEELIEGVLDRKIIVYHKARKIKAEAKRPQRNTPSRQHNAQVTEVNSDTEDSEDDVEEVILGNNMGLAQQDSAEEESLNINTAQQAVPAQENKLMIVHGALDSTSVRILIDSGASNLLCRPGLAKTVIRSKEVQAEGFDGHCSGIKKVKEVSGTLCFGQWTFPDLILTEWDLGKKDFDVILGKPWFFRCNPVIDWRTHQILNVNSSE